jgi:hypothetical protein
MTARANTSVDPPAGKDNIATIGFLGQSVSGAAISDEFIRRPIKPMNRDLIGY